MSVLQKFFYLAWSQNISFSPLQFVSVKSLRGICRHKQGWCLSEVVERKPFGSLAPATLLPRETYLCATMDSLCATSSHSKWSLTRLTQVTATQRLLLIPLLTLIIISNIQIMSPKKKCKNCPFNQIFFIQLEFFCCWLSLEAKFRSRYPRHPSTFAIHFNFF